MEGACVWELFGVHWRTGQHDSPQHHGARGPCPGERRPPSTRALYLYCLRDRLDSLLRSGQRGRRVGGGKL